MVTIIRNVVCVGIVVVRCIMIASYNVSEDIKVAIRIRISKKNRQHKGPTGKSIKEQTTIQNIHIKLNLEFLKNIIFNFHSMTKMKKKNVTLLEQVQYLLENTDNVSLID